MNRGIKVLQTSALPLGYVAVNGRALWARRILTKIRFCSSGRCMKRFALPSLKSLITESNGYDFVRTRLLERITGIEPATSTLARSRSTK